jgi:hypothetical protein
MHWKFPESLKPSHTKTTFSSGLDIIKPTSTQWKALVALNLLGHLKIKMLHIDVLKWPIVSTSNLGHTVH